MYIFPDFYKDFECIGGDCNCTCCAGWDISLDNETFHYYQNIRGRFGQFVRRNLYERDGKHLIKMDEKGACPFLDEKGLCQIYQNCGPEHLSNTCEKFPRGFLNYNQIEMRGLSLSCEEVLRTLYKKETPVTLYIEDTTDITTEGEKYIWELCRFLDWGIDLLQDQSIPFGMALGTLAYTGMNMAGYFTNNDFSQMEMTLAQAPEVLSEFSSARQSMTQEELEQAAWELIFVITDTFCQTMNETDLSTKDLFLWEDSFFEMSDTDRKKQLYDRWKSRTKDPGHIAFMRRFASALLLGDGMALGEKGAENIFLRKIGTYIILSEVLPPSWKDCDSITQELYFSRLAQICRMFDQAQIINNYIYPIICDLIHPDVLTYAIAFMVLFDE